MPEVGPTYPSIRSSRVEKTTAKKLVVNLSSTMTCTISDTGLITVDFK